jgi:Tfp pilus assembly protein PilF
VRERPTDAASRRFRRRLAMLLLGGALVRVAYTVGQAATDPWFDFAMLDARYYLDWAQSLAAGAPGPQGAFYLAPLYPYVLAALFSISGRSLVAVYALQQALILAAAGLVAVGARRELGERGALGAGALLLLHHPILYFAARPLGESLAVALLLASVIAALRPGARAGFAAGLLAGLASLARPNLLLVPLCWAGVSVLGRRPARVAALVTGVALVVAPVTLRNLRTSGHFVPISSNSGITAFHGNGPGARGIYTQPYGFPSDAVDQRAAATSLARARSGLDLDDVEADAWWGRQALRERAGHTGDTLGLLAWRVALTAGDREFGLDYSPMLDPNPLRPTLRVPPDFEIALVPWALLLGLAGAGVVAVGWRGSGGPVVWSAILACLATPILFYFSSRYRLPVAALLALPAGVGLAELARASPRRIPAAVVCAVLFALSLAVPSGSLYRLQIAGGLVKRAAAYLEAGDRSAALADARRALALDPASTRARLVLGDALLGAGRFGEAEAVFREGRARGPAPEAAVGLAASLAGQHRFAEAESELRRELVLSPRSAPCWNALVSVLYAAGDGAAAHGAAAEARGRGVAIDADLLGDLERDRGGGGAAP